MTSKEFRIFMETVRDLLVTSESKEEALRRFNELLSKMQRNEGILKRIFNEEKNI